MEDALSNFVILKNVFSFLSYEDVENCFRVSRFWRVVADSVIFRYYEIKISANHYHTSRKPFILYELDHYNRKWLVKYEFNLEDVIRTLEQGLLNHDILISLTVLFMLDIENHDVKNFLARFGQHVKNFTLVGVRMVNSPLKALCNFLIQSLPNLVNFHCSTLEYTDGLPQLPEFNPDLPHNKLKQLKRISFRNSSSCGIESYANYIRESQDILRMAPNLKEIHTLPIWLINEIFDKGPLLKSVTYDAESDGEFFGQIGMSPLLAFEKLAQLRPQLTSFSLPPSDYHFKKGTSMESVKPIVFSILQNCADSLRTFEMGPTEWYGFQNIPQLKGLQTLIFTQPEPSALLGGRRYFEPDTILPQIFPNVSGIRIGFSRHYDWIKDYLPENMFSPWGSQIKRLQVQRIYPNSISLLQGIFPEIEHLEFSGLADEIQLALPESAHFWPHLKSLTILVLEIPPELSPRQQVRPGTLDCMFTGFTKEDVDDLMDLSKRENFTEAQIQGFKNQSNICKFRELKQLTLTLIGDYGWDSARKEFTSLTHVTDDFGFKLLPDLKVTVGIGNGGVRAGKGKAVIRTEFEPSAGSSNEKIRDLYLAWDDQW